MSRVTHRSAISSAVTDRWQSTADIAQRAGLTMHRAAELLRQQYERGDLQRRELPSLRGRTFEYRRAPVRSGSGQIAGPVLYRGLALWPGPRML